MMEASEKFNYEVVKTRSICTYSMLKPGFILG